MGNVGNIYLKMTRNSEHRFMLRFVLDNKLGECSLSKLQTDNQELLLSIQSHM